MQELPKLKDGDVYLAIDPSSAHLAYVLAECDKGGELHIHSAGVIWVKDSWAKGKKLIYMSYALHYLVNRMLPISKLVFSEQFFANPRMLSSSSSVIPTVNNLLEMSCTWPETVPLHLVPPPTWRRILGIKAIQTAKGKDYKQPTADYVKSKMTVPDEVQSNITGKLRATPHDVTDALAIALAIAKENGYDKAVTVGNAAFLNFSFLDYLNRFEKKVKFKGVRQ